MTAYRSNTGSNSSQQSSAVHRNVHMVSRQILWIFSKHQHTTIYYTLHYTTPHRTKLHRTTPPVRSTELGRNPSDIASSTSPLTSPCMRCTIAVVMPTCTNDANHICCLSLLEAAMRPTVSLYTYMHTDTRAHKPRDRVHCVDVCAQPWQKGHFTSMF